MRRSYMYLRPGNLYKYFTIEESSESISPTGRPTTSYNQNGKRLLRGALAEASPEQKVKYQQLQHPITHTIVQDGRPKAKAEDKLILGTRVFLVQAVDEPGSIGICTIYYVQERNDVE